MALTHIACTFTRRIPQSQLPPFLAAADNEMPAVDDEGHAVSVDRSRVVEIDVATYPDHRLMVVRPWNPRFGPATVVAVPDERAGDAKDLGWSKLGEIEGPGLGMTLRGNTLIVQGDEAWVAVRIQDVAHVDLKEPNHVGTAFLVIGPTLGLAAVIALVFISANSFGGPI